MKPPALNEYWERVEPDETKIASLRRNGYWWCGRCRSVIPLTYWHDCDATHTHSAPYKER